MKSARDVAVPMSLDRNGFSLVFDEESQRGIDFMNEKEIISTYYPQCERLLREVIVGSTGKDVLVKAFDHNIRSQNMFEEEKKIEGGNIVQTPVSFVHGDYTKTSAPRRLEKLGEAPKINDALRAVLGEKPLLHATEIDRASNDGGRYLFVNVWRSIDRENPVSDCPLACCDAVTNTLESLLTFEIHYADRIGENYFARYRENHEWYYYPEMNVNETLLIKQWDSHGSIAQGKCVDDEMSTFSLHSAFLDPSASSDAPSRQSIEVRLVVII